ncbi:hypothetical protein QUA46_05430 [Microcoleus sp. MON2_D6]|uniref:hypothetical protein n=1 Tax=unclassified Microcoleus TaxID=2642155 RepID=UPI002FD57C19
MTNSKGAIALVDKFQKGDRLWLRKSKKGRSHFVTNSKRAMPLVEKKQERAIANLRLQARISQNLPVAKNVK